MRDQKCFLARGAMLAAAAAGSLFVFGAGPVRAQTAAPTTGAPKPSATGITAPATGATGLKLPPPPQGPSRRLTIEEAVLMALEQNVNLQVDRIDPQVQDLQISVARSTWTPARSGSALICLMMSSPSL